MQLLAKLRPPCAIFLTQRAHHFVPGWLDLLLRIFSKLRLLRVPLRLGNLQRRAELWLQLLRPPLPN
jgi:hypothetical protein